mgnify:CR=1 FL=1
MTRVYRSTPRTIAAGVLLTRERDIRDRLQNEVGGQQVGDLVAAAAETLDLMLSGSRWARGNRYGDGTGAHRSENGVGPGSSDMTRLPGTHGPTGATE